jgi:hypothetical protein
VAEYRDGPGGYFISENMGFAGAVKC